MSIIIINWEDGEVSQLLRVIEESGEDNPVYIYNSINKDTPKNIISPVAWIDNGEGYAKEVNRIIHKDKENDYILFLSTSTIIDTNTIPALLKAFETENKCCGINPVFIDSTKLFVHHLGTVADFCGRMHFLYEGIPINDKLAAKKRHFQIAHNGCLLIRKNDFLNCGGFRPELDELAFPDLCIRLHNLSGNFISMPNIKCLYKDNFESLKKCGLWNSLVARGKLPPHVVKADFAAHVKEDGLEYGINNWVMEKAKGINTVDNPYINWRNNQTPLFLLKFISSLDPLNMREIISLCQGLPAVLPRSFLYYKETAKKLQKIAINHNLDTLHSEVEIWLKRSSQFHYGELRKTIKAVQSAGIYNCSLDISPSVFDAWLELQPSSEKITVGNEWPELAVVMPVWNPDMNFFIQAINSIKDQTYPNWQLCIADDASTNQETRSFLESLKQEDKRVKVIFRKENGHISQASNSALTLVSAPWAAFMDQDDLLSPNCLASIVHEIVRNKDLRMIFSDEDHIDAKNIRRTPFFKTIYDCEIPGHITACQTSLINEAGCFRTGYEGSQDYDLLLRILEIIYLNQIGHIAKILYHWRVHEHSTAGSIAAKPYVINAARKALEGKIERVAINAEVNFVSTIKMFRLLRKLEKSFYFEIILMDSGAGVGRNLPEYINKFTSNYNTQIYWLPLKNDLNPPQNFNSLKILSHRGSYWSEAIKQGAAELKSDIIIFMDMALSPIKDCRLEQLVCIVREEKTGAAGATLWKNNALLNGGFYPDVTGLPFLLLKGVPDILLPVYNWGGFLRERKVLGVSHRCMAMRREIIMKNNFNREFGSFADVDFGLNLEKQGLDVIISPFVNLETNANFSLDTEDSEKFLDKWGNMVKNHGLRNSNLKAAPDNDWTLIL